MPQLERLQRIVMRVLRLIDVARMVGCSAVILDHPGVLLRGRAANPRDAQPGARTSNRQDMYPRSTCSSVDELTVPAGPPVARHRNLSRIRLEQPPLCGVAGQAVGYRTGRDVGGNTPARTMTVMTDPKTAARVLGAHVEARHPQQTIVHPRRLWPREADFTNWLAANLDSLATCLDVQRLEYAGREVVIGERWEVPIWPHGRERTVGGMRVDLAARDDQGRLVLVETQIGMANHAHLGQLITYGATVAADLAVWVVAGLDPEFAADHLAALAELNEVFAGRRTFCVIAVTVESQQSPAHRVEHALAYPRLRRIDLRSQTFAN
jgi:hypothetical protein